MAYSNFANGQNEYSYDFKEGNVPPPQYGDIAADHSSMGGFLTVKDFIPALISRANEWLQYQPQWEAKTCESIELKCRNLSHLDTDKMTYLEYGDGITVFVRCLRLWLVPRIDASQTTQQIGFVNIVPAVLDDSRMGWPVFQSLDDTLRDFNANTRTNPNLLPGRVITVETQEIMCKDYLNFDPNKSCWKQSGRYNSHYLVVIRVFYEQNPYMKEREEIGVADFKPVMLEEGGFLSTPVYEPFSNVIRAATEWCAQQTTIRYCNAQTYEVKLKSDNVADTQRMTYMEYGKGQTVYVRILRVAYVTLMGDQVAPQLILSCKNFVPYVLVVRSMSADDYDTFSQTQQRIEQWLRTTGARVLSCETAAMRLNTGGERKNGVETSVTHNYGKAAEQWIYILRVFLDGIYAEPPAEVLNPPPRVEKESCALL